MAEVEIDVTFSRLPVQFSNIDLLFPARMDVLDVFANILLSFSFFYFILQVVNYTNPVKLEKLDFFRIKIWFLYPYLEVCNPNLCEAFSKVEILSTLPRNDERKNNFLLRKFFE